MEAITGRRRPPDGYAGGIVAPWCWKCGERKPPQPPPPLPLKRATPEARAAIARINQRYTAKTVDGQIAALRDKFLADDREAWESVRAFEDGIWRVLLGQGLDEPL